MVSYDTKPRNSVGNIILRGYCPRIKAGSFRMTDQKHYPMPELSEQEREDMIAECEAAIKSPDNYQVWFVAMAKLTMAALTAPKVEPSHLAELAGKVRDIRQDMKEFDGDNRGIWECLEDHEKLLLEEAVKYTAPPVPALNPIKFPQKTHVREPGFIGWVYDGNEMEEAIRAAGQEVKE